MAVAVGLVLAGLALRATNLGNPSFSFDEYYHVFAAESLLEGEGLRLPSGRVYDRAALVTLATAASFRLFGEGEAQARLPALAFGAGTLVLTYAVGCSLFGSLAGTIALALVAFSPNAIDADRYARLYSPLTFFTLLAAFAAFRTTERLGAASGSFATYDSWRRWAALAVTALAVGVHLHPMALSLAVVLQVYALLLAAGSWGETRWQVDDDEQTRAARSAARRYAAVAAVLAIALGVAAAVPQVRARLLEASMTPLAWYRPSPGDLATYHYHLVEQYTWIWYLVWPASVILVVARPRAGLFTVLAFWLPLVVLSGLVVTKSPRYVTPLLPFAWLILGGAVQVVWPATREALIRSLEPLWPCWPRPSPRNRGIAAGLVVLVAMAPVLRLTPSLVSAVQRPTKKTGVLTTGYFADWRGLGQRLAVGLPERAVVVSSVPFAIRYYLGRSAHHLVSPNHRLGAGDWDRRARSDAGQVQTADHLETLRRSGVPVWVMLERFRWENGGQVDEGLKRLLISTCRRIDLPAEMDLVVLACDPQQAGGGHAPQ
jgi:hypothetical protein